MSVSTWVTPRPTGEVFTVLFRNRNRSKMTPGQVAEELCAGDPAPVKAAMETIFFADLLHMTMIDGVWHWGITARARRIVKAVGLDGVTDELIRSEYSDAMAWRKRKAW